VDLTAPTNAAIDLPVPSLFEDCTVTSVNPLRIRRDGDSTDLPFAPDTMIPESLLAVSDRVRVENANGRLIIVGRGTGIPVATAATPDTLILRDANGRAKVADPSEPDDIDTMGARDAAIAALYGWERVVPSGVSSTGATATVDASGVVTCPAGTTAVGIDGILHPDYETEVVFRGRTIAGASTGHSMRMRATSGGVPDANADYYAAGSYSLTTAAHGWYGATAATSAPVGAISTGTAPGAGFNTTIRLRQAWMLQRWTYGFHAWNHFGMGSRAEGFTPSPSGQYDGLRFFPDGTGSPSFQGEFTVYRRRIS